MRCSVLKIDSENARHVVFGINFFFFFLKTVELRDNGNNDFVFGIGKVECDTFGESEGGRDCSETSQ